MKLTPRQKDVLEFIRDLQEQEGISPSIREICARFGLRSPATVHEVLKALEKKGFLVSSSGRKRAWRLVQGPARKSIPVLGRIAAGVPIHAREDREDELPMDPGIFGADGCFALRVQGDSMIEAHIADGDLAIIQPQPEAEDGRIVAVMVEGILPEATLKRFRRKNARIELHAENGRYPPMVFEGEEQAAVTIIGKLVGVLRKTL